MYRQYWALRVAVSHQRRSSVFLPDTERRRSDCKAPLSGGRAPPHWALFGAGGWWKIDAVGGFCAVTSCAARCSLSMSRCVESICTSSSGCWRRIWEKIRPQRQRVSALCSITDRLVDNRLQQLDTVILLDDIDEAEPPVIDAVARLAEFDRTNQPRLTIVATATTSQLRCIEGRLLDLAELRIELEPWEQADTVGYVMAALRHAGRRDPAFDDDAMIRLHELCDGIPRRIAQLANLSCFWRAPGTGGSSQIDADIVESALQELASIAV